jgi:hypothetical protein
VDGSVYSAYFWKCLSMLRFMEMADKGGRMGWIGRRGERLLEIIK